MLLNTLKNLAFSGWFVCQRIRSDGRFTGKFINRKRWKTYAPKVWRGSVSILHLQARHSTTFQTNFFTQKQVSPMSFKDLRDFPTLFGERLSSIIYEDVTDFLREVKEYTTKIIKEFSFPE